MALRRGWRADPADRCRSRRDSRATDPHREGSRRPSQAGPGRTASYRGPRRCRGLRRGAVGRFPRARQFSNSEPRHRPRSADYEFDVAEAREGGSAGAATLVLQAVLPPLLRADGDLTVTVHGGTHMAWSPPFDYLQDVWLAAVARMGADIEIELRRSGWFPVGQGEIRARVRPSRVYRAASAAIGRPRRASLGERPRHRGRPAVPYRTAHGRPRPRLGCVRRGFRPTSRLSACALPVPAPASS